MHFHYCGNILHDIVHNFIVLIYMLPEWLPFAHNFILRIKSN